MRSKTIAKFKSLFMALLLAAIPAGVTAGGVPVRDGVGMDVSGFQSVTFEGEPVDGSIFAEAEMTVINIWQRWCGPCWAELPAFQQLYEHYSETPEADVRIWGALYYGDNPDTIQQAIDFVAANGYEWPQMLMCDEFTEVASGGEQVENLRIPQTLIIDRYGIVRAQHFGSITEYEELAEFVGGWLRELRDEYAAERGDVDGNGTVDSIDALLALQYALGAAELDNAQLLRGDINGDGGVDSSDALLILRFTMGLIPAR